MLNKKYAYRLEFMMVTGILVILVLIGRMFYLQIIKGSTYRRQAEGNRTRYTRILAPRGIIYDCNGEELANNKPGVMVSLVRRTDGYREEHPGTAEPAAPYPSGRHQGDHPAFRRQFGTHPAGAERLSGSGGQSGGKPPVSAG